MPTDGKQARPNCPSTLSYAKQSLLLLVLTLARREDLACGRKSVEP